ncbi:unnamed protein product [Effrenium voratum]|uniref:Uncharacterized protein n=1 Tax=Effrenium voratum TaxID=2562239 RepID=A0AA36NF38_9DINO|nr:unnamed protein product [Effrenium voratum]
MQIRPVARLGFTRDACDGCDTRDACDGCDATAKAHARSIKRFLGALEAQGLTLSVSDELRRPKAEAVHASSSMSSTPRIRWSKCQPLLEPQLRVATALISKWQISQVSHPIRAIQVEVLSNT